MIKKPHCIIIGAMKSGTTTLFSVLKECQEIDVSNVKDTMFFVDKNNTGNWHKGANWYARQFPNRGLVNVEASTLYAKYPDYQGVPARIIGTLYNVKLIYLIRNPIERAIAHYFHNRVVDREIVDINFAFSDKHNKYFNYSDYGLQMSFYLQYIEKSNILMENLVDSKNKKLTFEKIKSFVLEKNYTANNPQAPVAVNTFKYLIKKHHDCIDTKLKDIVTKEYENKAQMALEFGLKKDILEDMIYIMQNRYNRFAGLMGVQTQNWVKYYEEYI